MPTIVLAEGTLEEFENYTPPVQSLPHGTPITLDITCYSWAPVAPLFDLFGAEWAADMLYNDSGTVLDDVEGVGWYTIRMHMHANAAWVVPLIFVVLGLLGIAGLAYIVSQLRMIAEIAPELFDFLKWGAIAVTVVGGLLVLRSMWPKKKEGVKQKSEE